MKYIVKNISNEPASLKRHRLTPRATYDNLDAITKDDIRRALLKEQGFLCCYCMQRISLPDEEKMKIEHFLSQSDNEAEQLKYTNMLAACKGGDGRKNALKHCDTAKGSKCISVNPMNKEAMQLIRFDKEGRVYSANEQHTKELEDILHLNLDFLKSERSAVGRGIRQKLERKFGKAQPRRAFLQEELNKWQNTDNQGMLKQYCQVAIYVLEKELKRSI